MENGIEWEQLREEYVGNFIDTVLKHKQLDREKKNLPKLNEKELKAAKKSLKKKLIF